MPDPLEEFAINVIGGAAGGLLQNGAMAAGAWVKSRLGRHDPEAQERARANTAEFLGDLATRVKRVEDRLLRSPGGEQEVRRRFAHPDAAATFQEALIASARTESRDKHGVLAEVVAARLAAEPESIDAIVASMAVETVPRLSRNQMEVLGVITLIFAVSQLYPANAPLDRRRADSIRFTERQLSRFGLPEDRGLLNWDLIHLDSLGSVAYEPIKARLLTETMIFRDVLGPGTTDAQVRTLLESGEQGRRFLEAWERLRSTTPTPLGMAIGGAIYRIRGTGE